EPQKDMSAHRMGENDHRERRMSVSRSLLLDRFDVYGGGGHVGIVLFEAANVARAIAAAVTFGCALAAPVEADHEKAAGFKLCRRLAVFLEKFGHPVQEQADGPRGRPFRQVPD